MPWWPRSSWAEGRSRSTRCGVQTCCGVTAGVRSRQLKGESHNAQPCRSGHHYDQGSTMDNTKQKRYTQRRREWAAGQAGGNDHLFWAALYSAGGPDYGIEGDYEPADAPDPEGVDTSQFDGHAAEGIDAPPVEPPARTRDRSTTPTAASTLGRAARRRRATSRPARRADRTSRPARPARAPTPARPAVATPAAEAVAAGSSLSSAASRWNEGYLQPRVASSSLARSLRGAVAQLVEQRLPKGISLLRHHARRAFRQHRRSPPPHEPTPVPTTPRITGPRPDPTFHRRPDRTRPDDNPTCYNTVLR